MSSDCQEVELEVAGEGRGTSPAFAANAALPVGWAN